MEGLPGYAQLGRAVLQELLNQGPVNKSIGSLGGYWQSVSSAIARSHSTGASVAHTLSAYHWGFGTQAAAEWRKVAAELLTFVMVDVVFVPAMLM